MPYFDHVLEDEGSRRAAVKLLTRTIEASLVELTINAPDWSVNT
jgi:glycerol-3-phosphate O-acyltransferase / dihydroxyacetone phosphate acyltransferase